MTKIDSTVTNPTADNPIKTAPAKPRRQRSMTRQASSEEKPEPASPVPPKEPRPSKIGAVIALLSREGGATLAELIEATGWLPHTARATLTGLRKKGHTLEKTKRGDVTCYRIEGAA
ncbi:MAG: DUF3489 domain-containing protein [Novosphingobium sp.]